MMVMMPVKGFLESTIYTFKIHSYALSKPKVTGDRSPDDMGEKFEKNTFTDERNYDFIMRTNLKNG